VPQDFDIPKICVSGGCTSEDTQTLSNVWYENGYNFCVSPVAITLNAVTTKTLRLLLYTYEFHKFNLLKKKSVYITYGHTVVLTVHQQCKGVYSGCRKYLLSLHSHFMFLNHN